MRIPEGSDERSRAELVARVMRGAEIMARLRHPVIVAVHDVLVEDGRSWIVTERRHGRNLALVEAGPRPYELNGELGTVGPTTSAGPSTARSPRTPSTTRSTASCTPPRTSRCGTTSGIW
ncbi:hypothetical protein [Streptosporangium sp. NPDC048865]|uniref:hypothetical protein n=1 Tax=Streptosporangium sp. NPDC048865 TaxID=3155766 RepID=UPI00341C787D